MDMVVVARHDGYTHDSLETLVACPRFSCRGEPINLPVTKRPTVKPGCTRSSAAQENHPKSGINPNSAFRQQKSDSFRDRVVDK